MHLAAQEDKVNVAEVLVESGCEIDSKTKAGYTPLHTACHFGQVQMHFAYYAFTEIIRFR